MVSGLVDGCRLASATPVNPCARKLRGFEWKARRQTHKTVSLLQLATLANARSGYHSAPPTALFARQNLRDRGFPRAAHRFAVSEPLCGLRRERSSEPVAQRRWKPFQIRALAELTREYGLRVVVAERRYAGERENDDRGEREIIGRRTLRFSKQLLGRRECGRTSSAGVILSCYVRDAEIRYPPPIVAIDQNVLGFQIAVKNAVGVRDDERVEHLLQLRRDL